MKGAYRSFFKDIINSVTINLIILMKWTILLGGKKAFQTWQDKIWIGLYVRACAHAQSSPSLCYLIASSPPGSSVQGISQARIAISYSRGSSWPKDQTHISCIGRWILYHWATWEAQPICKTAIKSRIKNLLMPETAGWGGFSGESFQIFEEKLIPILYRLFQRIEKR